MELLQALIDSGNVESEREAQELISELREQVLDGENPEELLYELGLEPDYVIDLLF